MTSPGPKPFRTGRAGLVDPVVAGEPRVVGVTIVMAMFERVAPIFGVRDVRAALEYYETLGFRTRSYGEGIYGFAARDGNVIRFGSPIH